MWHIFPSTTLNCSLNPLLELYFSCFYVVSSQTEGKLSRVRDCVLEFFGFLKHQTQSCKEQVLGPNWLLWFWLWRPDLVHTGCQGRDKSNEDRVSLGITQIVQMSPSSLGLHHSEALPVQSRWSLLFLSYNETIKIKTVYLYKAIKLKHFFLIIGRRY